MGSHGEMDALSEIFYFLLDTIPGCLIQSPYEFYFISADLVFDWLVFAYFNAI